MHINKCDISCSEEQNAGSLQHVGPIKMFSQQYIVNHCLQNMQ